MALTMAEQLFLQAVQGTNISYSDWLQQYASVTGFVGQGISMQQGVTAALPILQPLLVTYPGGMGISFANAATPSAPQFALTQAQLCAATAVQAFTVPNNATGSTRNDAVCVQPGQLQSTTVNREVEASNGTKSIQAIPIVYFGLVFQYVTGPSGGGAPTIPAGFDEFCTIAVPNGAVSINAGEVTVLFPTMNPQGGGATMTTSTVTAPAIGISVSLPVARTDAFPVGTPIYAVNSGATVGFTGTVTARSTTSNAGNLTVTVNSYPIGVPGSFASGATVTFGGIAGAIGASGHGTTSNIAPITLPGVGQTVSFAVLDPTAFPAGTLGYIAGPGNLYAFFFIVNSVSGNTLTVTLTSYALGGISGASLSAGGTVTFSGIPALVSNTSPVIIPAVGSSVNIPLTHAELFPVDSYGILYGPLGAEAFVFQVNSSTGSTINVTNLGILAGVGGGTVSAGGQCYPQASVFIGTLNGGTQPLTIEQSGIVLASAFNNSGTAPCYADVSLQLNYSITNYNVQLTPTQDGAVPFNDESQQHIGQFRIRFGAVGSPSGACDVHWKTTGH